MIDFCLLKKTDKRFKDKKRFCIYVSDEKDPCAKTTYCHTVEKSEKVFVICSTEKR